MSGSHGVPRRVPVWVAGLCALVIHPTSGSAQELRPYHRYLPRSHPPLVGATVASQVFDLYGPGGSGIPYVDRLPDGIHDDKGDWLRQIAERFAPVLARHTQLVPADLEAVLRQNDDSVPILLIDTWDVTTPQARVVGSPACVALFGRPSTGPFETRFRHGSDPTGTRCRTEPPGPTLDQLLESFHPDSGARRSEAAEAALDTVLYFNLPGVGDRVSRPDTSWSDAIGATVTPESSRIYAHVLIAAEPQRDAGPGYRLVLQFWLFYPYNDGGNNHEGDWEHINVHLTTRAHARSLRQTGRPEAACLDRIDAYRDGYAARPGAAALDSATVDRIVNARAAQRDSLLDELTIWKVDYYFHHWTYELDYLGFDYTIDASCLKTYRDGHGDDDWGTKLIHRMIWDRINRNGGRLATHPVGYIGADNEGIDQLLGGRNRDSHGTYPFPGVWTRVGPFDATEVVAAGVKGWAELDSAATGRGELRFRNPAFLNWRADRITVVPDWERLLPTIGTRPDLMQRWAWLLLPIRWGFPSTSSPGAGLVNHADMGNLGPVGPAHNSAWNRIGAAAGYDAFVPYTIPATYPMNPWHAFLMEPAVPNAIVRGAKMVVYHLPVTSFLSKLLAPGAVYHLGPNQFPRFVRQNVVDDLREVSIESRMPAARAFTRRTEFNVDRVVSFGGAVARGRSGSMAFLMSDPGTTGIVSQSSRGLSFVDFWYELRYGGVLWPEYRLSTFGGDVSYTTTDNGSPVTRTGTVRGYDATVSFLIAAFRPVPILKRLPLYARAGLGVSTYRIGDRTVGGVAVSPPDGARHWDFVWNYGFGLDLYHGLGKGYGPCTLKFPSGIGLRLDFILFRHARSVLTPELESRRLRRSRVGAGITLGC